MRSTVSLIAIVALATFLLAGGESEFNPKRSSAFERGYYVPESIEDAVVELKEALGTEAKSELRSTEEDQIAAKYHETLGSWMRRHWLYQGSRLRQRFASQGLQSRDEASSLILKAVWRDLNERPIQGEELLVSARNAEQAIREPEETMCPNRSDEQMEMLFKIVTVGPIEVVHVARCRSTGEVWTFEIKKGWFRPDPETLVEINRKMRTGSSTP